MNILGTITLDMFCEAMFGVMEASGGSYNIIREACLSVDIECVGRGFT